MDASIFIAQEVAHIFKNGKRGQFKTRLHNNHYVLAPKAGKWSHAELEKVAAVVAPVAVANKQVWRVYPHPAAHVFG